LVLLGLELRSIMGYLAGAHPAPWLAVAAAAVLAAAAAIRLGRELAVSPLVGSCPDGRFGAIITQETWKGISPTVPAAGLSG
jgi:hypothetical protein